MDLREQKGTFPIIFFFFAVLFFCIFIGKGISAVPFIPLVIIFGIFMFFTAFTAINFAMALLIFAMLLSPEMAVGAISKQRNIVVRIDDLLTLTFTLAWLAKTTINKNMRLVTKTPINLFIGLYMISFIIPTVNGMIAANVSPVKGLFYIFKYLEYFAIFYLTAGVLKDKQQIKKYLKAFLITFAIVNIFASTQIGTGRVSAPFEGKIGEPNTLGGYQVLMLGIIIGLLTHTRSIRWRWPLFGLAIFSLVPFAFTLSRASYMAIIPMYLTLIFFSKGRMRDALIGILILLAISSIFLFPPVIKERIAYTFTPEVDETVVPVKIGRVTLDPSASARINDWVRLFEGWKRKPFIGYGLTGAGFVDSQFISVLVETGVFGLFAFILLLWKVSVVTLRIYKSTKDDFYEGLAIGFLAGHIGMIVHAFTANTFILIRIMEPYWFLAAIVMMIPKLEISTPPSLKEEKPQDASEEEYITNAKFLVKNGKYNAA